MLHDSHQLEAFPAHFSHDEILVMDEAAPSQEMQAAHAILQCLGALLLLLSSKLHEHQEESAGRHSVAPESNAPHQDMAVRLDHLLFRQI